jgi:hypothetical protein
MAYRDFTLEDLKQKLGLRLDEKTDLFSAVAAVPVSALLQENLREGLPLALAIGTEKARSELIIAPVLMEVRRQMNYEIGFFSGVDFPVDLERGLNGVCDFILSLSTEQLGIEAPAAVVVEAKKEDMRQGIVQCAATLVAAQLFNRQRHSEIEPLFGAVTTGNNWKFLRITGTVVHVDTAEYYIKDVDRIVGILLSMLRGAQQLQPHAA